MRTPFVAGNWKMLGSLEQNQSLVKAILEAARNWPPENCQAVVCPSFVYLSQVQQMIKEASGTSLKLGAQDVSAHEKGAYTGQVSANMLKEMACEYAIVGHSERREYNHESNELVADKFFAAMEAGITPILCVGETLEQREADQTAEIVLAQLNAVLQNAEHRMQRFVLAYEPVWAIGTGKTATPDEAQEVHQLLREEIAKSDRTLANSVQILYGGSVKVDNAESLFSMPDIDGGLIGGASLIPEQFIEICNLAHKS